MSRRTKLLITFIVPALIAAALTYWYAKYTVVGDEKQVYTSLIGYRLEKYRFWNQCSLTIWKSSSKMIWQSPADEGDMQLSYTIPNCYGSPKVVETRWMAHDSSFYLHLIKPGYSYSYEFQGQRMQTWIPDTSIKIIYDFRKGAMYLISSDVLWRVADPSSSGYQAWFMKEEEFQKELDELSKTIW